MHYTARFARLSAFVSALALFASPVFAAAAQATVIMTSPNAFNPPSVVINQGDSVLWVNQIGSTQSITSNTGLFDSGPIQSGGQFSATFNQPGTFGYHSAYGTTGTSMAGTVTVNAVVNNVLMNPNATYLTPQTTAATQSATTGSNAQLIAQVQALLAQVQALEAQNAAGGSVGATASGATCPVFGRMLKLGMSGSDVTHLQQFLAQDSSVYPEGVVSGYFGPLTQAAVQRWQAKHSIVSSGSPATTGYGVVGSRTSAAMSSACALGPGGAPVGGFIQVSPVSGSAPLAVNVTAIVNTGGSCASAIYTLDFGDGSAPQAIQTASGNCSQQSKTYQHTYIYGGVYQVTLAAGGHQTSAQVSVSGPAAPANGMGVGTVAQSMNSQPTGTISAFSTSGTAPFTATFYVSCAVGSAYDVVFGDGTDLGGTGVSGAQCKSGSLVAITHAYNAAGSFQAQLEIFTQQSNGTIVPVTVGTVPITVGSVAANYTYQPPRLSTGSSAQSFNLQFDLPTSCTGYDIDWGDGTAHAAQNDGGTSCAQTATTATQSHTYPTGATGSTSHYTITLKRGPSLAQANTVSVTFSQ